MCTERDRSDGLVLTNWSREIPLLESLYNQCRPQWNNQHDRDGDLSTKIPEAAQLVLNFRRKCNRLGHHEDSAVVALNSSSSPGKRHNRKYKDTLSLHWRCVIYDITGIWHGRQSYYPHSSQDERGCKALKGTMTRMDRFDYVILSLTCTLGLVAMKLPGANPFSVLLLCEIRNSMQGTYGQSSSEYENRTHAGIRYFWSWFSTFWSAWIWKRWRSEFCSTPS